MTGSKGTSGVSIQTREHWARLRRALERALDDEGDVVGADESGEVAGMLALRGKRASCLEGGAMTLAASAVALDFDSELAAETRIGRWNILRTLNHGGMGSVYLAQAAGEAKAEPVALKIIRGMLLASTAQRARFEREARLLQSVDHAGIPRVIDYGANQDTPWFVMEYVDGASISNYCDANALGAEERLRLTVGLARILEYVHSRGLVHRDIKASNVLVDARGKVKLVDFGLAKLEQNTVDTQFTRDVLAPMTLESAAPEQFRIGGHVTARTDVYQFGVLVYKLLTGAAPYCADPDDFVAWGTVIANERPRSLRRSRRLAARRGVPDTGLGALGSLRLAALEVVLAKAMAKRPFDRYATIGELAKELDRIIGMSGDNGLRRWIVTRWAFLRRWIASMPCVAATPT